MPTARRLWVKAIGCHCRQKAEGLVCCLSKIVAAGLLEHLSSFWLVSILLSFLTHRIPVGESFRRSLWSCLTWPMTAEICLKANRYIQPSSILGLCTTLLEMATHSSILAWRIPWTEDPDRLQSMGSQRVGHNWATSLSLSPLYWKLLPVYSLSHSTCLSQSVSQVGPLCCGGRYFTVFIIFHPEDWLAILIKTSFPELPPQEFISSLCDSL